MNAEFACIIGLAIFVIGLAIRVSRLEKKLRPQAQMFVEGWQTISTAPKEGTSFLATMAGGNDGPYYVLFWNDNFFESVDSGECPHMDHITHWRPLPAPPSTTGEPKR